MNFSLKKLLTMSAAQLIYLNQHKDADKREITSNILKGQEYQKLILNKLNESKPYNDEMGGVYMDGKGNYIYFSHDIVKYNGTEIFETKYANDNNIPTDYIQKSLFQCAVYDTLTRFSSPFLHKSKFAQNSYNYNDTIELKKDYVYYLSIGNKLFKVKLINPYPILDFINEKISIVTRGNYNEAKHFDGKWKGNEYHILRKCFSVIETAHQYLI